MPSGGGSANPSIARKLFGFLPFGPGVKKHLKFAYFATVAAVGIEKSPAGNALDAKARAYLPHRNGVFVEVGANDGVTQSNTWTFEKYHGWTGLLIEPVTSLANMARRFRRGPVANVALGEKDGGELTLWVRDLMTTASEDPHATEKISVPVRSLSSLLDEHGIGQIDLFSLDVEGYELPVLAGLDLARHRPRYILVETSQVDAVTAALSPLYVLKDKFSVHDYLFESQTPIGVVK